MTDGNRLHDLILRWEEDALAPGELEELTRLLESSRDARGELIREWMLSSVISERSAKETASRGAEAVQRTRRSTRRSSLRARRSYWLPASVAAAVLAGAIFYGILSTSGTDPAGVPERETARGRTEQKEFQARRLAEEARARAEAERKLAEIERRREQIVRSSVEPSQDPGSEEKRKKDLAQLESDKERIEREMREAIARTVKTPVEGPQTPEAPRPSPNPQEKAPAVPPAPSQETRVAAARVDRVEGEVVVVEGEKRTAVQAGQELMAGQGLETVGAKSFVSLCYPDKTRLEMGVETRIEEFKSGGGKRVVMTNGTVRAEVAKQPKDEPMVFTTPHGAATVVGTTLRIVVDPDPKKGTRLEVEEGKVQLKNLAGKTVLVESGHYAVAAVGVDMVARPIPPNLLVDPGFEKGGRGWRVGPNNVVPPTFVRAGRLGSFALQAAVDKSICDVFQVVPVKGAEEYRAAAWVKTQDLRAPGGGPATAVIRLVWMDSRGKDIVREDIGRTDPTQDWTRLTGRFIAPAQAATVRFQLFAEDGSGTIWLDDCEFSRIGR